MIHTDCSDTLYMAEPSNILLVLLVRKILAITSLNCSSGTNAIYPPYYDIYVAQSSSQHGDLPFNYDKTNQSLLPYRANVHSKEDI